MPEPERPVANVFKTEIDKDRFHCPHVVSVFHGGADSVDNLRLCCPMCNESMGTMSPMDFKALFGRSGRECA